WVNYWGSWAASRVYNRHRMARKLRRVTTTLAANLETESHASLGLQMAFPTRWDPFFRPVMTVADLYAYPTKHFAFHAQHLSFLPHTPGQQRVRHNKTCSARVRWCVPPGAVLSRRSDGVRRSRRRGGAPAERCLRRWH